jgi:mRNA interferase RelE/StbE
VSEPYGIRISARAERDLLRLPEKVGTACVEFIFSALAERPRRVGGLLTGPFVGLRSARRGNYRIVYRIDEQKRQVEIVHIDRRSDVYR